MKWYAKVVKSGRTRLRSWWAYLRHTLLAQRRIEATTGAKTEWWLSLLGKWSEGDASNPNVIWVVQSDALGGKYQFHFLRHTAERRQVFVWMTDSLSVVWTVNQGRYRADGSATVLNEILRLCDDYHLQLLALWVRREETLYADYPSHLASSLPEKK